MNILLPWSLASYFPYHGFSDRYRGLAQSSTRHSRMLVPAEITQPDYVRLLDAGIYRSKPTLRAPSWTDAQSGGSFGFRDHVAAFDAAELAYLALLPGDVELHHSAPVTSATRPFALLCDTVMPLFSAQLEACRNAVTDRSAAVREFYRTMLESEQCVMLASSNRETLDEISNIFDSGTIDRKLEVLPHPATFDVRHAVARPRTPISFMFQNSAHGEEHPFRLSGGVACLHLALDLLRDGFDVRFYFQSMRPSDFELTDWGIDTRMLARFEDNEILWIDPQLDRATLAGWVAGCHFLLMPGSVEQPELVAAAMACGTVPIVSDLVAASTQIADGVDGVVLCGLRDVVFSINPDTRMPSWDVAAAHRYQPQITRDLIRRVRDLVRMPERIRIMSEAAHCSARCRARNEDYASRLVGLLEERLGKDRAVIETRRATGNELPWGEDLVADLSEEDFSGPATPRVCADVGTGKVFALRQHYIFVPNARLPLKARQHWSLPALARQIFDSSPEPGLVIASSLGQAAEAGMPSFAPPLPTSVAPATMRAVTPSPANAREVAFYLAYAYLKQRPALFPVARAAFHLLRRMGIWR